MLCREPTFVIMSTGFSILGFGEISRGEIGSSSMIGLLHISVLWVEGAAVLFFCLMKLQFLMVEPPRIVLDYWRSAPWTVWLKSWGILANFWGAFLTWTTLPKLLNYLTLRIVSISSLISSMVLLFSGRGVSTMSISFKGRSCTTSWYFEFLTKVSKLFWITVVKLVLEVQGGNSSVASICCLGDLKYLPGGKVF